MRMSGLGDLVGTVARWLNPVTGSTSSPLETTVFVDSFGPSLMPRTSVHQGLATGLSLIAARGVTKLVDIPFSSVIPSEAGLGAHLTGRAVMGGAGAALAALPVEDGETMWVSTARTGGQIVRAAAIGGAIYDVGIALRRRYGSDSPIQPLVITASALAGVLYTARRRRTARQEAVGKWPIPQEITIPTAVGTAIVVSNVGRALGWAYKASRDGWIGYLGPVGQRT